MKLWGYYAWHTFKNSIKKMFRSTVAAVFVAIIVIGATFGVAFSIIDMVFPDDSGTEYIEESSQYEGSYVGDEEDGEATNDEDYDEEEMTEEDIIFVKKLIESGVFLLIIIGYELFFNWHFFQIPDFCCILFDRTVRCKLTTFCCVKHC